VGIYISPLHPPLEGEGGRKRGAAVNGSDVPKWYVSEDYTQNYIERKKERKKSLTRRELQSASGPLWVYQRYIGGMGGLDRGS
jgi:hypothetical protein